MTIAELEVLLNANTSGLDSGLAHAESKVKSFGESMKSTLAPIAALFATLKIGEAIKDSISAGMESVESENLFGTAMGNMAQQARDFSMTLQDQFGLNGYEVRKNTANFYMMAQGLGFANDKAYQMSTNMVKLSYDMASFRNLDPAKAFDMVSAAMVGNTEQLRGVGIVLTENMIKQEAYKEGLAQVGKELSQQAKSQAVYNLVLNQTKNDQGDLARTMNSPANQMRILRSELDQLKIAFGQAFLPILQIVLPAINTFVKGLITACSYVQVFIATLFGGTANSAAESASSTGQMATGYDNLTGSIEAANAAAKDSVAGFDEINSLTKAATPSSAGASAPGIDAAAMPSIDTTQQTGQLTALQQKAADFANSIKDLFAPLKEPLSTTWDLLKGIGWDIIQGFLDMVKGPLKMAFDIIVPPALAEINRILGVVKETIEKVIEKEKELWKSPEGQALWKSFCEMLVSLLELIGKIITDAVIPAFSTFFGLFENKTAYQALTILCDALKWIFDWLKGPGFPLVKAFVNIWVASKMIAFGEAIIICFKNAGNLGKAVAILGEGSLFAKLLKPFVAMENSIKAIGTNFMKLAPFFESIGGKAIQIFSKIGTVGSTLWPIISGAASTAFTAIGGFLATTAVTIAGIAIPIWAVIAVIVAVGVAVYLIVKHWADIKAAAAVCWQAIQAGAQAFWTFIVGCWNGIVADAQACWTGITNFASACWTGIQNTWNGIVAWFQGLWSSIVSAAQTAWSGISTFASNAWTAIQNTWNGITTFFSGLISTVTTAWGSFFTSIGQSFSDIYTGIQKTFNGIITFITGVFTGNWKKAWQGVKDIFGGIFDAIGAYVKLPINAIISGINVFIKGINKIQIPSWVPGVGGKGFSIAQIPKLAQGGIIDKPTIAQVGEAGPEAVVPLKNTAFVDTLASAVGNAVMSAISVTKQTTSSNSQSTGDVVLKVNETVLGQIAINAINKVQKSAGEALLQF